MAKEAASLDHEVVDAPFTPALSIRRLGAMSGFLSESVLLVDTNRRIVAALGPSSGVLGHPDQTGNGVLDDTHPDDLPKALAVIDRVLTRPWSEGTYRARARHIDGTWRILETWVSNRTEDPELAALVVRARDATFDEATSPEVFGSLTDVVPIPVVAADRKGLLMYGNAAARELMGFDPAVEGGSAWAKAIDEADRLAMVEMLGRLKNPGDETSMLFAVTLEGRGRRWIRARVRRAEPGGPAGWVATLVDDTDQVLVEDELRRRATRDALTGLPNRQAMFEHLNGALSAPTGAGVAVIFFDLDGFKHVNDIHGHATGDRLLVAVAEGLTAELRGSDLVARVGGDEFVAVCPDCGPKTAQSTALRLAGAVAAATVDHAQVRASFGVATSPPAPNDATLLMELADRDMYQRRARPPEPTL